MITITIQIHVRCQCRLRRFFPSVRRSGNWKKTGLFIAVSHPSKVMTTGKKIVVCLGNAGDSVKKGRKRDIGPHPCFLCKVS